LLSRRPRFEKAAWDLPPETFGSLGFLKKLTLTPATLTAGDARAVLALGVSKAALADAIYVASTFNIYDRLADSMGWQVPAAAAFDAGAKRLLSRAYVL
jgi:alkylhydroperoxidase family enzyme